MKRSVLNQLALVFAVFATQLASAQIKVHDIFNRELNNHEVSLVDWQGHLMNPMAILTLSPPSSGVSYPLEVTIKATGTSRLMMDWPSSLSATGAEKTITFNNASETIEVKLAIAPDRVGGYGEIETHQLTFTYNQQSESIPIKVLDLDDDLEPLLPLVFDYRTDNINYLFNNSEFRTPTENAVKDWFYFFDYESFDMVPVGDETISLPGNNWTNHVQTSNNVAYNGYWIFTRSIDEPYSTGFPNTNGKHPEVNGVEIGQLPRSSALVLHNNPDGNWFTSTDDEDWYLTSPWEYNDVYGVCMHEFGHAIVFHNDLPGFVNYSNHPENAQSVVDYQGFSVPVADAAHLVDDDRHWDRLSGHGAGWSGVFPVRRWSLTKLTMLIAQEVGWKLREIGPFMAPEIVTDNLPAATPNEPYNHLLESNLAGYPVYDWTITAGALPAGLTLNRFTGEISGTVNADQGIYNFTVRLKDADERSDPFTKNLSIQVGGCPVPTNVEISDITQTGATVSWDFPQISDQLSLTYQAAGGQIQTVNSLPPEQNISQNKPSTASGIYGVGYETGLVNDGNETTRWASAWTSAPYWIYIDLEEVKDIGSVRIVWDDVAIDFTIDVSNDKTNWTTVKSVVGNDSPTDVAQDFTGLNTSGRYLRIHATKSTTWCISIWELIVYPKNEITLTGLNSGTQYNVQLQSICDNVTNNSETVSFNTLSSGTWTKVDDRDASVSYDAYWGEWPSNPSYNTTVNYSETTGATATFSFNGTKVRYYGFKRDDLGYADIYIDDVFQSSVDCYGSTLQTDFLLYESGVLANGQHTLKIVVSGNKNPNSSGTEIIIDAFGYYGGQPTESNLAPDATLSVSSEYSSAYGKEKMVDGITGQWGTGEWASSGESTPWAQLNWDQSVVTSRIVLYERANINDHISSGTLTFSDGGSVPVGELPNNGDAQTITFSERTITWVKFQVDQGTGPNNGLSEFEVFGYYSEGFKSTNLTSSINTVESILPKVYPNPANSQFTVEFPIKERTNIEIINMLGKVVYKDSFNGKLTLSTSNLKGTGIFLIKLSDMNNVYINKLWLNK